MNRRILSLLAVAAALPLGCINWSQERAAYCLDGGPGCRDDEYPEGTGDGGATDGGRDAGTDAGTDAGEEPFEWDGGRVLRPISPQVLSAAVDTDFAPIEVELINENGVRPEGVVVTFAVDAGGCEWECEDPPSASFNVASPVSIDTDDTNSQGRAQAAPLRANTRVGSYQLIASAQGYEPLVFVLHNTHGVPRSMAVSGQNQGARPGEAFRQPITVQVLDAWSNPVLAAQVRYTAQIEDGLAFGTGNGPDSVLTGMDASVGQSNSGPIYAREPFGDQLVTVEVADGGPASQSVRLQVITGPAYEVSVLTRAPHRAPNGGLYAPILVEARDDAGYPLYPGNDGLAYFTAPEDEMSPPPSCQFENDPDGAPWMSYAISQVPDGGFFNVQCRAVNGVGSYDLVVSFPNSQLKRNLAMQNGPAPTLGGAFGGNSQMAAPAATFTLSMQLRLQDALNEPVPGARVIFKAPPTTGPSVRFLGAAATVERDEIHVWTDAQGIADSGPFQANNVAGNVNIVPVLPDFPGVPMPQFTQTIQ